MWGLLLPLKRALWTLGGSPKSSWANSFWRSASAEVLPAIRRLPAAGWTRVNVEVADGADPCLKPECFFRKRWKAEALPTTHVAANFG